MHLGRWEWIASNLNALSFIKSEIEGFKFLKLKKQKTTEIKWHKFVRRACISKGLRYETQQQKVIYSFKYWQCIYLKYLLNSQCLT